MKHFVSQYRLLHIVLGAVFVLFCVPGLGQAQIEQQEFRPMDFAAIGQYDYEQSRKPLAIVEDNIRIANSQQKAMIEQQLIGLIESATATLPAKDFACRLLRRIGTEASIGALGDALENEDTFDMARFALEGMESKEVDALFRRILKRADGAYRLGMVSSIANRGDEKAVRLIARYLDEEDMALKEAAIQALGQIGGDRALRELQRSDDIPKSLNPVFYDSLMLCADKYIEMDQEQKAEKLFKKLSGKSYPDNIRVAAINGLVQARGEHVAGTIARLVKDDNPTIRKAAINEFVTDLSNTEAAEELIEVMDDVEADTQVLIIKTLVSRNERLAHREIYELTMADEPAVQNDAIRALGKLGDASYVPHLI
ncbi:hypothetical protein GF373_04990 [bacterium]|nr:hypothetical protein [bacterium]